VPSRDERPKAGPSTVQGIREDSEAQERTQAAELAEDTPSPEPNYPEGMDPQAIAEDKRRRNTAASARFRVKKKTWTMNLERSISDLSTRVEELEREAAELRRENGWLKEIVMLKSKRFGGSISAPALSSSSSGASSTNVVPDNSSGQPGHPRAADDSTEGVSSKDSNRNKDKGKGKARETSG